MLTTVSDAMVRLADLGGPVVVILVAVSILTTAVVLYKIWQFQVAGVGRHAQLRTAVAAWDAGDQRTARAEASGAQGYMRDVVMLGMAGQVTAERLEAETEERFAHLEGGFRFLDSVAQLTPLLGLFGTVLGMIAAFQALQEAGDQVDPAALAGGIWVALLTTAVGLAIAMPTSMALSWLEARLEQDRILAGKAIRTLVSPAVPHSEDLVIGQETARVA